MTRGLNKQSRDSRVERKHKKKRRQQRVADINFYVDFNNFWNSKRKRTNKWLQIKLKGWKSSSSSGGSEGTVGKLGRVFMLHHKFSHSCAILLCFEQQWTLPAIIKNCAQLQKITEMNFHFPPLNRRFPAFSIPLLPIWTASEVHKNSTDDSGYCWELMGWQPWTNESAAR